MSALQHVPNAQQYPFFVLGGGGRKNIRSNMGAQSSALGHGMPCPPPSSALELISAAQAHPAEVGWTGSETLKRAISTTEAEPEMRTIDQIRGP